MPQSYIKRILSARVYDVAVETPITEARFLSQRFTNRILFKREDLQSVFSFKCRGAYNKMVNLPEAARQQGVIASSAGNHAQGLALAASQMGVKASIVMPRTTPQIKVDSVKSLGAKVILYGDAYDDAAAHARELMEKHGYEYVHPFDDPDVIAGQGTIAMEILRQHSGPLQRLFVPVGGGGLLAGIAAYVKYLRPDIKLIGVEAEDSACLNAAMKNNRRVVLPEVGIFADGVAVAQIGKETYRIIKETVDEVMTVNTDEICAAIKDIFDDTRSIAEPAGAIATAGLKKYVQQQDVKGEVLLAIISGANVNFDRLRHISERSEIGEKREALISVTIPEQPGSFKKFCQALGKRNVTEFNYRYHDQTNARIFVGVAVSAHDEGHHELLEQLRHKAYPVVDLSDNEMAKLHIRHMVGGRALVENERIFRFEFPERPGALMKFLTQLGHNWNISMFHYRNHGAAFGRVLVGMQVPPTDNQQLNQFFADLGYRHWEETENEAYQLFLN